MYNNQTAVDYVDRNAGPSKSKCATYVRAAIIAGGQPMGSTLAAQDFGPYLKAAGFTPVTDGSLQPGDVSVIQGTDAHPYGHMTMWDGNQWVSDFKQGGSMYPPVKPGVQPYPKNTPYTIYRHPGVQAVTHKGHKVTKTAPHHVHIGHRGLPLAHRHAKLSNGGKVADGSTSVYVGVEQYAVARVGDQTTDGSPIAIGEDSILAG